MWLVADALWHGFLLYDAVVGRWGAAIIRIWYLDPRPWFVFHGAVACLAVQYACVFDGEKHHGSIGYGDITRAIPRFRDSVDWRRHRAIYRQSLSARPVLEIIHPSTDLRLVTSAIMRSFECL